MTKTLNIALAQLNPTVGDIDGNLGLLRDARTQAKEMAADLMVAGELVVSGYPPEDLLLKPSFIDAIESKILDFVRETSDGGPAVLLGAPWRDDGKLYNAALLIDGGAIVATRFKRELPNYGVFDEMRVFEAGPMADPIDFRGMRLGVMVCEDLWEPAVAERLAAEGGEVLVVLNGSPFDVDKKDNRFDLARARAQETGLPLVYVNLVGGQDELVFDGDSFVTTREGELAVRSPSWLTDIALSQWNRTDSGWVPADSQPTEHPGGVEAIYRAACLGLRDYVNKNHFPGVLIGMSGGIDSALSAAIAVDALGPDRVHCVMMPSPYTSDDSLEDAAQAAGMMGAKLDTIGIAPAMAAFDEMLKEAFTQHPADTTEENIQARSRGMLLMALSNKFGHMVLSTGNKSEMSVGYATLYGDMCGGFSVLKDIYKTTVFAMSRWRNAEKPEDGLGPDGPVMPERIITKPPSAELKPDQKDEDSLPPYEALDDILHGIIENDLSLADIVGRGHDAETVERVWMLVDRGEYKRRQAPPGVKISSRAFGRDRRYPITNGFKA
ncbi:MAG: NAD+ synthase [Rhodospirillaceae bacterium]|jgi:NAD+ synthase|nr:NAD+ synthase [Rhodospirillaceae bacterium]MBT4218936.1 NAD+ synthase [Rhodospirillaceae bacterium]MBT4463409.1 NAD+ synthase [Rhodospirillaceae bacterium]MBT6407714.1 NAD+ synthase [Rhodospirillaceae bacterium]MBT7357070.1 NAD+ synthase [Rhodospirillaceae bacterium]